MIFLFCPYLTLMNCKRKNLESHIGISYLPWICFWATLEVVTICTYQIAFYNLCAFSYEMTLIKHMLFYQTRRCGMIVPETVIHQIKIESKFLQVTLRPKTMNQGPYHKGNCKRLRNTKLWNLNRPYLYKNGEQIKRND